MSSANTIVRSAELDCDLLCAALRMMIERFEWAAERAGCEAGFIERCTEAEAALVNRVELAHKFGTSAKETTTHG